MNLARRDSPKLRCVRRRGIGGAAVSTVNCRSLGRLPIDLDVLRMGLIGRTGIFDGPGVVGVVIPSASGSSNLRLSTDFFRVNRLLKLDFFFKDFSIGGGGSVYGRLRKAPPSDGSAFSLSIFVARRRSSGCGFSFSTFGARPRVSGGGIDGLFICAS